MYTANPSCSPARRSSLRNFEFAATPPQTTETLEKLTIPSATNGADVADRKTRKPAQTVTCGVVAAEIPESAARNEIEPNPTPSAPVPDDDDIEREAIMNEAELDDDQSAPKTAWDI